MSYKLEIKREAELLRKQGKSLGEISDSLKIAKSTASAWTSKLALDKIALDVLSGKKVKAWQMGLEVRHQKRESLKKNITDSAKKEFLNIRLNIPLRKLICSIFIWTEGTKFSDNHVGFMNSDPLMVFSFLILFRKSFILDETKFRGLIHVHEYHNEPEIRKYWSNITHIPISQFSKSYLKPNTGKRKRAEYMGSIAIRYYDYKIALELRAFYNTFADNLGA